ncbi:ABC transporter substrate-binding protein [Ruania halotolerans]|uniref:ABC transporter substrate-binding protein n=1 Tax=Ruania halotolerans TaxID=2897773 RepID=UPI001E31A53B|nr:extracellular solute-binding protein [Ruania halotolerans]UFU08157.1 extracellular solute-binding protein [Ruania halotolerans]
MTTRTRLIFAALPAALILSACGGGDGGDGDGGGGGAEGVDWSAEPTGTLSAWGFNNADDVGQSRLDYAEEQLADVEIELDATGFDAQKFTTRLASGDVPDVVQMDRRYVATYAAQDLLMPLDECYAAHDVAPEEDYYPFVIDDMRLDGQIWGVGQFFQPPAILLNMEVLNEAGVSPEDIDTSQPDVLLDAIEAMYQEDGGVPSRLGLDPVATGQGELWILGMGGQLTDADGVPTLDDPSNLAGLELLQQITDAQGGFAEVKSFTDSFDTFGENNQYVANQVGAQVNAQWYPNVLVPYIDDLELQAVPFRGPDGEPFSVASGTAFVVPAGAENPTAACAWMLNLTSLEGWEAAGQARGETREADGGINTGLFTGSPQADTNIREEWVVPTGNEGLDQVISTYYEVLGYGQTYGASPAGQDIQNELNNAITTTLLGEASAEDALADAQAAAMRAYDNITAGG